MSRIGKKPVPVPSGVTASLDGRNLSVKGPRGELAMTLVDEVSASVNDNEICVIPRDSSKRSHAMWGMQRSLLANLVKGVSEGFTIRLDIVGVGYRAAIKGKNLELQLGFSHNVVFPIADDVKIECPSTTSIVVSGNDKQRVGQVAAKIRAFRPPEPYKGKGVKYADEVIFRKEGKKK